MFQSEQNCSKTERLPQSFRPCSISLGFGTTRPAPRGGVHEKAVAIGAQSCDRNPATSAHAPTIEGQGGACARHTASRTSQVTLCDSRSKRHPTSGQGQAIIRRPKGDGRCIHCRETLVEATKDHVFPSSWYPDTTPDEVQRWTAPSCQRCNVESGRLEEDLLVFFRAASIREKPPRAGCTNACEEPLASESRV